MKVNFYATLRQVVAAKSVEFTVQQGCTIRQLITEMIRCYPALHNELLNEQGELYQHVHVFFNGRDALFHEDGLDTVLPEDAVLGVFPAVGGG